MSPAGVSGYLGFNGALLIPAALAWQATRRMKRGLRETSNTKKEPLP